MSRSKKDKRELKRFKALMNIKPPTPRFELNNNLSSAVNDYIKSKLMEKSCAEQMFPSRPVR